MNEKKFRKSPIAIACYVIAGLLFIYSISTLVSTINYINEYYGSYGLSATDYLSDSIAYVLSAVMQPLVLAVLVFMAGYILEEVRSQNPIYYYTDEEKAARKEAKAAAKAAKAEAKAAKAEAAKALKNGAEEVVEAAEETAEAVAEEVEEVVEAVVEEVTEEN